jgi:hypothetical protein
LFTVGHKYDKEIKPMQKKTRSILEELDTLYNDKYSKLNERRYVVESRASNVIASAVRLMEQIDELYEPLVAEDLQRKLLNSIRLRDPKKFSRSVRRADESK